MIEVFGAALNLSRVTLESDEVGGLCPWNGQPDFYTVRIEYVPGDRLIESQSLKYYLQTFRDERLSAEELASRIADDVSAVTRSRSVSVRVTQKARGGITLTVEAVRWAFDVPPPGPDGAPREREA